jgi:hypothetical protein
MPSVRFDTRDWDASSIISFRSFFEGDITGDAQGTLNADLSIPEGLAETFFGGVA